MGRLHGFKCVYSNVWGRGLFSPFTKWDGKANVWLVLRVTGGRFSYFKPSRAAVLFVSRGVLSSHVPYLMLETRDSSGMLTHRGLYDQLATIRATHANTLPWL